MKNIQKKTNEICYCLGGGIQNLGGGKFPPLKALKKHCRTVTAYNKDILHCCMGVDMEGTECSCAKN